MLCGIPPFYNKNYETMYKLIKEGQLKFPKRITVSDTAKDLISKLLEKNPVERLGKNGLKEIKEHEFFAGLDFDAIERRECAVPFVPEIKKDKYKYFDDEFLAEPLIETYIDKNNLDFVKANQEKFKDFK